MFRAHSSLVDCHSLLSELANFHKFVPYNAEYFWEAVQYKDTTRTSGAGSTNIGSLSFINACGLPRKNSSENPALTSFVMCASQPSVMTVLNVIVFLFSIPLCLAASSVTSDTSGVTPVVPVQPTIPPSPPTASPEANVTRIFKYPGGGFENLAVRSNGQILATLAFPEPLLFYVDPLSIRPAVLLHNFTSLRNTGGITELAPDRFYGHGPGINNDPYSVYSVDMRQILVLPNGTIFTPPVIKEIGTIPSALLLNGMTHLRSSDNFVLISDTLLGGVWKFYVDTGKSELVIQDPSMAGPPNQTAFAAFGINGLRVQNNTLFYCNSGAQKFYKMPVYLRRT